jgi:ParB-like chromosome segregation protein Spo0J
MRLKACIDAGLSEVPVIHANNLTEEQKKEFIIKDNISFGEHNWELLANEWNIEDLDDWGLDIPEFANNDIAEKQDNFKGEKVCPNCGVSL